MVSDMLRSHRSILLFLTMATLVLLVVLFKAGIQDTLHSPADKLEAIINSTSSCRLPCWHGLTPGESTENDFLTFANSEYATLHFQNLRKNENPVTFYLWYDSIMEVPIEIRFDDNNLISFIRFAPDNFTFGTISNQLGYPDAYEAAGFRDMSYFVTVKFFYESEGLVVWINTEELESYADPCKILAYQDMSVRAIYITHPGPVDEMIGVVDQFFDPRIQKVRAWPDTDLLELKPCP